MIDTFACLTFYLPAGSRFPKFLVFHDSTNKAKSVHKEVDECEGESDEASVNGDCSRMDKKDDNDTSEYE